MSDAVISTIRSILADHGRLPVTIDTLADDGDLYAAGLTSFASVQVMLAIEDRFNLEFPDRFLNRRTFGSIAAIGAAVAELTTAEAA